MLKKALLFFLLLILLLFVVVIGSTFFLLGTESGFAWTSKKIHNLDDRLTLAPASGNLTEGVATSEVNWEDESLSVNATGIDSKWSSSCLLKTTFCLQYLNIDELKISTRSKKTTDKPSAGPLELPNVALPLRFKSEEINIGKLILANDGGGEPLEIENIKLQAEANGSDISIASFAASFRNYSLVLSGDIKLEDDYPIDATLDLRATDVIDQHDVSVKATLSNTLRNLKVSAVTSDAVVIAMNADIQPLEAKIPIRLNTTWDKLGWPIDSMTTVASNKGKLKLIGNLDDYIIRHTSTITGNQLPQTDINLDGKVNTQRLLLPRLDLLLLDGFVTGSVAASWTDGVNWVSELIFKEINPGKQWDQMNGALDGLVKTRGTAADGKWAMSVDTAKVEGTLREFPFQLDALVAKTADDVWLVNSIKLANGPNALAVNGQAGKKLDLDIALDFPTIHSLLPTIAGDLTGKANVTGEMLNPSIKLDATSKILKAGNLLFRDMTVQLDAAKAGLEKSDLKLEVATLNSGGNEIKNVEARLLGTRDKHNLKAFADGPSKTSLRINTDGSLSEKLDWNGLLKTVAIEIPGHKLTLAKPFKVEWLQNQKRAVIDPHCWLEKEARLCLENPITSDKQGAAKISLKGYQLNQLNAFLPAQSQLSGSLGANSDLQWDLSKEDGFSADLNASVSNGVLSVIETAADSSEGNRLLKFTYDDLTLKARADPYTVVSDLYIKSRQMGEARVSMTLNPKNEKKTILGDVDLNGFDIGFAKAFLPGFDEIAGKVNAKGEIAGNLTDPTFNGRVSLLQPIVRSRNLPLSIDGGALNADIKGKNAELSGDLDSGEGSIAIGGSAGWSKESWKADINVKGEKLVIVQKPIVHSEVYPTLRIALRPGSVDVNGRVVIPTAEINIKDRAAGGATLSDDVIIIEDEEAEAAEEINNPKSATSTRVVTKVDVLLGNDVNLSGYGLEARLTGDINVLIDGQDPPQLGGEITVAEGFYKSYGQDLNIKDGQILFVGPVEQTTLNIDAVREIDNEDRVAGLQLTGPIADPTVTLFTTPGDKSQESILSYIVLGRDLGSSTNNQESTLLAQAALALTLKQGRGFATGFAESLGISDFTIDASGSGDDTQVVVSGRLSSKLLLRYGRDVFLDGETLFLRYDISKKLYLEAAQGVQSAVDLFYSFSF